MSAIQQAFPCNPLRQRTGAGAVYRWLLEERGDSGGVFDAEGEDLFREGPFVGTWFSQVRPTEVEGPELAYPSSVPQVTVQKRRTSSLLGSSLRPVWVPQ